MEGSMLNIKYKDRRTDIWTSDKSIGNGQGDSNVSTTTDVPHVSPLGNHHNCMTRKDEKEDQPNDGDDRDE